MSLTQGLGLTAPGDAVAKNASPFTVGFIACPYNPLLFCRTPLRLSFRISLIIAAFCIFIKMSNAGNPSADVDHVALARKEQAAKDLVRAKDAGWNNPVPFNYDTVVGGVPNPEETRETAGWLSEAVVYQWDDDFGDVGEPNPDVEKALFFSDHMQRQGTAVKALEFDVTVEGPEKVLPVRNVSRLAFLLNPLTY